MVDNLFYIIIYKVYCFTFLFIWDMAITKFMQKFILLEKSQKDLFPHEWDAFYDDYRIAEIRNKAFVLNRFQDYLSVNSRKYSNVISFIQFLGDKENFRDTTIAKRIKEELNDIIDSPHVYAFHLETLFSINRDDSAFYIAEFKERERRNQLNMPLSKTFLRIFQDLKNNDLFMICLKKLILDNTNFSAQFAIKKWFEYLISLENEVFKKYFLDLLAFFTDDEKKKRIIDFYEYGWIIDFSGNYSYDLKLLQIFLDKLNNTNFSDADLKIIKDFVFSEYIFACKQYSRKIFNDKFIEWLFNFLFKIENTLIIDLINENKEDNSFFNWFGAQFVIKYLNEANIATLLASLKDNVNLLFYIYDALKEQEKESLLQAFHKNKALIKELKKIEREGRKWRRKYQQQESKRIEKEKKSFLELFNVKDSSYNPKAFQDYCYYLSNSEIEKKFSIEELNIINKNIEKQIGNYLNGLYIDNYNEDKINDILHYEQKDETSYSYSRNFEFLKWVFKISHHLNIQIDKYYKIYILFYPWFLWDDQNKILEFLDWKITKEDIDYILKVYSEDLHDKAIWFRYYNPQNLCYFYNNFSDIFAPSQKKRLEQICLEMLQKVKYKNCFLEIYSSLVKKDQFKKLYNESKLNYFKNILNPQQELTEEQRTDFNDALLVNKVLILKFEDKDALLRRVRQLQEGEVECKERDFYEEQVFYVGGWLYEELRHSVDEDSFSYAFSNIPNIDIRDEMLDLLKKSFKIESQIQNQKISADFLLYSNYLKGIFYMYIKNLNNDFLDSNFYRKIVELKWNYKTCNLDLLLVCDAFSIEDKQIWKDLEIFSDLSNEERLFYKDRIQYLTYQLSDAEASLKQYNYLKHITGIMDASCIIFVEWEADKIHFDTFFNNFFNGWEKKPFVIPCVWCRIVTHFLQSSEGRDLRIPIVWIYDFDGAGVGEYYKMKEEYCPCEENYFKGRSKKHNQKQIYASLLPIPNNEIQNQVIYEDKKKIYQDYGMEAKFQIEHLFYGIDERLDSYLFEDEVCVWGGKYKKLKISDRKKTEFARNPNKCLGIENSFQYIDPTVLYKNFKPIGAMVKRITQSI